MTDTEESTSIVSLKRPREAEDDSFSTNQSLSEGPPSFKFKNEEPTCTTPPFSNLKESPDYFFEDGNVNLLTSDDIHFCVHRGVLSMHSSRFRELFATSLRGNEVSLNGLPTYNIEEGALELRWLLEIMYTGVDRCAFPSLSEHSSQKETKRVYIV